MSKTLHQKLVDAIDSSLEIDKGSPFTIWTDNQWLNIQTIDWTINGNLTNGINVNITITETVDKKDKPLVNPNKPVAIQEPQLIKPKGNPWGMVGRGWALYKQAANYYGLTVMTIQEPESDTYKHMLDSVSNKIAEQFSRYTDMAVGGEIRHTPTAMMNDIPQPLAQALLDNTIGRSQSGVHRDVAWNGWFRFKQKYGTVALLWATETFNTAGWNSSYGGKKWGHISHTLYMYERELISKHIFIDTCWGLEHNGGTYFNKWFQTDPRLQQVLDLNLEGQYCTMVDLFCGEMVKKVIGDSIKESCLCKSCS